MAGRSLPNDQLQMQLHSARKSILFMETQHASTLKGLHTEIQHLQKKCSELTFNLAMKDASSENETKHINHVSQLESEVSELMQEKIDLVQQVESRDRQLVEIEEHANEQEKKYLNELKIKKHKVTALLKELDSRSNTIAYLSAQLHQAHAKLAQQKHRQQQQSQPHRPNQAQGATGASGFSPTPPPQPKSSDLRRSLKSARSVELRPASSSGALQPRLDAASDVIDRPSSSSGVTRRSHSGRVKSKGARFVPSPMPDPAPFLDAGEKGQPLVEATRGTPQATARHLSVLPPIKTQKDANGNDVQQQQHHSQPWLQHQGVAKDALDRGYTPPRKSTEAESLALNRVIPPKSKLHQSQVHDF